MDRQNLAGRRGTIDYSDLVHRFQANKQFNALHGTNFEFMPMQSVKRHEWHGKKCTVLAKHGGVVRIDGVGSAYELVPMKHIILEDEA